MTPTPDDFRALARSSPWLWREAHLSWRPSGSEPVEAWVRRPGVVEYRCGEQPWQTLREGTGERARFGWRSGEAFSETFVAGWLNDQPVTRRADGLVTDRPEAWAFDSDPMLTNYYWCAALDPAELAAGVLLDEVREGVHHGRSVWSARCVPVEGYEPRCGCCPLLWSAASDLVEYGEAAGERGPYPVDWQVSLDRATGVVVRIEPGAGSARDDLSLDVQIHSAA